MKRQKLNYRFRDPNDPAVAAEYIFKVFAEAVEKAIKEASAQSREVAEEISGSKII